MTNGEMARALRRAADALEKGAGMEYVTTGYDGVEFWDKVSDAEETALALIEPEGGEYADDVDRVAWGIFVPMQVAKVEELDDEEHVQLAKDTGVDKYSIVTLVDAWPDDGMNQ